MYVITAATGNTGQHITRTLLSKGARVRVVGRDAERLKPLAALGAEPFVGAAEDSKFMTQVFAGAKAVYTLVPPPYSAPQVRKFQNAVSQSYAEAITANQIRHVVNLSSAGAQLAQGFGPVNGLHDHEQRFNLLSDTHILHLRPGFFMENQFFNIALIKAQGINGSPLRAELAIPMIATQDIAAVAAQHLLALDFSGKSTMELLGQRDISMQEVTRILGAAIGKPDLPYVQFGYEDARAAMMGMGLSADMADVYVELYRYINDHGYPQLEARSAKNTTPTRFEDFAQGFAAVYGK